MKSLINKIITEVYQQFNLKKHNYFLQLQSGAINKKDFIASQQQMYWAVEFFPNPICILASKIPHIESKSNIIKNIWEEHGNGNIQLAHKNTFIKFLSKLGVSDNSYLQKKNISATVNFFNTSLVGACYFYEYKFAVAMLGIIEHLFVDASNIINQVVINNKWIVKNEMVHYNAHEVLDVEHARDFFSILEIPDNSNNNLENITQGLYLGAHMFNQLYNGLLEISSDG